MAQSISRHGLGANYRLLVVDDHAVVRDMLTSIILQESASLGASSVFPATNGEQGVALAGRYSPGVVVMDIGLPGIDGFEAVRRIKEQFPTMPAVMVTAIEEPGWREEATRAGAVGLLPKHSTATDLVPLLSRVLQLGPGRD